MGYKTRTELKTYFETGDVPTESEFIDLIDSLKTVSKSNTFTPAIVFDYDEKYFNQYTQSGALSITLDSNTNGQASSVYVTIQADASNITFPATWKELKNDYVNDIGLYGLLIFYDGVYYQYSLYVIEYLAPPPTPIARFTADEAGDFDKDASENINIWYDGENSHDFTFNNDVDHPIKAVWDTVEYADFTLKSLYANTSIYAYIGYSVDFTLIFNLNIVNTTTNQVFFANYVNSGEQTTIGIRTGSIVFVVSDGVTPIRISGAVTTGDRVVTIVYSSGIATLRIDGVVPAATGLNSWAVAVPGTSFIGSVNPTYPAYDYLGKIKGIRIYNTALTGADLLSAEADI